jgi:hypothetical protein
MDNNVLASPKFSEILDEIKEMGFVNGATYIEPNQLTIIKNLIVNESVNFRPYIRKAIQLLNDFKLKLKNKSPQIKEEYHNSLINNRITNYLDTSVEQVVNCISEVEVIYEKYRNKSPKKRFVDFNQGTDARYVTPEIMKKMSEIPIRPLRIAFDYLGLEKQYVSAIRLAAENGIKELSNYILYNFNDKPEELYKRLKINVDLNEELKIKIFSFPMKFIPLFGEEAKNRDYLGKHWNRKYIRAIQSILNVTKGIVAPGTDFFSRAFGNDLNEFMELLLMPETYIVYRKHYEDSGKIDSWKSQLKIILAKKRNSKIIDFIKNNDFAYYDIYDEDEIELLKHYHVSKNGIQNDKYLESQKKYFENLIKKDNFKELTLTYDYS